MKMVGGESYREMVRLDGISTKTNATIDAKQAYKKVYMQ